jgi:hypothetical protein
MLSTPFGLRRALRSALCGALLCALALTWALEVDSAQASSEKTPGLEATTASKSGSLTVGVVGLPRGQKPSALLRGPNGLRRSVPARGITIANARPGVYRLTLSSVKIARASGSVKRGAIASALTKTVSVHVSPGRHALLTGTYSSIVNPGLKTLTGGEVGITGPAEDPTAVALKGHVALARGTVLSLPPSLLLPRGLLSDVTGVSYTSGNTKATLTAASIYQVAPNFQFDVPLQATEAPTASAADLGFSCDPADGLSPYRHIRGVSISGGWSTFGVFGHNITDGVRVSVHFTAEAGLNVTAGVGLSCAISASFSVDGMAGPIPVTAGIEGELAGSADVGGVFNSGGSIEVNAGGHTIGVPPVMTLIPDVSFTNPHFTMTTKSFAQASAGIGLTVKAGVGVGGIGSLTMNVGSGINFSAQPGTCLWNAKFGQFSAEGELLDWHLNTPKTPALFTQPLGGNVCASSPSGGAPGTGKGTAPGGGGSGGGSGGGPGGSDGGGEGGGASGGGGWKQVSLPPELPLSPSPRKLGPISCPKVGECTVLAADGEFGEVPEALTLQHEVWTASAMPTAPGPGGSQVPVGYVQIACTASGQCVATGVAQGAATHGVASWVIATESSGTWTLASLPPPPNPPSPELVPFFWGPLSCPAVNACVVTEKYKWSGDISQEGTGNGAAPGGEAVYAEQANGSWSASWLPVPPPTIQGATSEIVSENPSEGGVSALACPAAGNCTAVGKYSPNTGEFYDTAGVIWTLTNGTWTAQEGPGGAGYENGITSLSCPDTGHCAATANKNDYAIGELLQDNDGGWSRQELPVPAGAINIKSPSVACASALYCMLLAVAEMPFEGYEIYVATDDAGSLSSFTRVPEPEGAKPGTTILTQPICASGDWCAAAGETSSSQPGAELGLFVTYSGSQAKTETDPQTILGVSEPLVCPAAETCVLGSRSGQSLYVRGTGWGATDAG